MALQEPILRSRREGVGASCPDKGLGALVRPPCSCGFAFFGAWVRGPYVPDRESELSSTGAPVRRGRLRRADCAGPGIRRIRRGRGFSYEDGSGGSYCGRGDAGADPRAGDPARLEGGLDLPRPVRPHPGDRLRRSRAQAVPLPRALAAAAGGTEVRAGARVRRRAAEAAPRRHRRPAPPGDAARAGAGLRGPPPRPRLLPRRRRGLRRGKRELRPRHRAPRARHDQARARSSSTSPPRAASGGCSRSATPPRGGRSRRCTGAAAAPRTCSPTAPAANGSTSAPTTSTSTSTRRSARSSRRRTSAPGTGPCSPRSRSPARSRRAPKPPRSGRSPRAVNQVSEALGNTPAVCRASYIDPRVIDRFRDGATIRPAASANGRMSAKQRLKIEREVIELVS